MVIGRSNEDISEVKWSRWEEAHSANGNVSSSGASGGAGAGHHRHCDASAVLIVHGDSVRHKVKYANTDLLHVGKGHTKWW